MAGELPTPVHFLKFALRALPPPLLRPALRGTMQAMQRQHEKLFRRLCKLAPARILFVPDDTRQAFLLTISEGGLTLEPAARDVATDVTIKGRLESLLELMEGRVDSDTAFFSRAVRLDGDTAKAVGFRNTLDGETISLLADALATVGPLEAPGRKLVLRLDRHLGRVRGELLRWRDGVHARAHGGRDPAEERAALTGEIDGLRKRVAQLEAARRRPGEAKGETAA